jgi:hypothetical protein
MDTKQLLTEVKARFNHNLAKEYLKDKYDSKLIFAEQGGLWKASTDLLTFLNSSTDETLVLLDSYQNPVEITRITLLTKTKEVYNTVMSDWLAEWKQLESKR